MTETYRALAEDLVARGVHTVFGLLSGGIDRLIAGLVAEHGVRDVSARHEQAAVGMADGNSRATGQVGVAVIGGGPGLTNAATALCEARLTNSRVLVIVGDTPEHAKWDPARLDHNPLLAQLFASEPIQVPAAAARRDLGYALRQIELTRAPVALNVALDVLTQQAARPVAAGGHTMIAAARGRLRSSTRWARPSR